MQRRLRLAGHDRVATRRGHEQLHERAVPRLKAARRGQRRVGVGGDIESASPQRQRRLGQQPVIDVVSEALDDRERAVGRGAHRPQAAGSDREPQAHAADHQHGRASRKPISQQPRRRLGRGHDVGRRCRNAHAR